MKRLFRKIAEWFSRKYDYYTQPKYNFEVVKDDPDSVPVRKVFIIKDGKDAEALVFKCPCGCGENIYLNLLKDARPKWSYKITKKNGISIFPSVNRVVGCHSHFYLSNSRIDWV